MLHSNIIGWMNVPPILLLLACVSGHIQGLAVPCAAFCSLGVHLHFMVVPESPEIQLVWLRTDISAVWLSALTSWFFLAPAAGIVHKWTSCSTLGLICLMRLSVHRGDEAGWCYGEGEGLLTYCTAVINVCFCVSHLPDIFLPDDVFHQQYAGDPFLIYWGFWDYSQRWVSSFVCGFIFALVVNICTGFFGFLLCHSLHDTFWISVCFCLTAYLSSRIGAIWLLVMASIDQKSCNDTTSVEI